MSQHPEGHASKSPATIEDLVTALAGVQQQMIYLEKKIDNLIAQAAHRRDTPRGDAKPWGRPSKVKHFGKPYSAGGHGSSGDKKYYGNGKPSFGKDKKFATAYGSGKPSFDKKKKFFTPATRREPRDR